MNKYTKKPVILIVLDGWGYREDKKDNAIAASNTDNFNRLWAEYPHSLLKASGDAVGLPEGQMGNSEVGHMTIGAGKPIDTDLVRIDKAISTGEFDKNIEFLSLFAHVKKYDSVLHVQGLVSPGGVHSHQNHLFAFLRLAKKSGVKRLAIHVFTDGRDTPPQSASQYIKSLEDVLEEINTDIDDKDNVGHRYFIATISGRYYAMDRDNNWDRLARVEQALFECKGNVCEIRPSNYMNQLYESGKNDELMEPTVCATSEGLGCAIKDNDAVFFFNFRADRARMLSEKLLERQKKMNIKFVTLTEYCVDFICKMAFPPMPVITTLGNEVANAGLSQARIAETEKFAHATYFLNGGREKPFDREKDILIESRKDIKTHDQAPEMRAVEITDAVIRQIEEGTDFIFVNFANADMVGHTANVPSIIKAVETVDSSLGKVVKSANTAGGIVIIIADHGNAEINIDPNTGTKHTAHTTSPVPCIITDKSLKVSSGGLADIAPTVLKLLNIAKPAVMSGHSLI